MRKVANFTGDFSEGRDPCGSGDGDEIRKIKHNHAQTAGRNRKRTGEEMTIQELLKKYEVKDIDELNSFILWLKWNNEQKSDIIKEFLKVGEMAKNFID